MTLNTPTGWPVESDWTSRLKATLQSEEFNSLLEFVDSQRQIETVYPAAENVFSAFKLTSFADTKVVILGQDPYHGPDQAHGLSFSVQGEMKLPPSLKNIYKELANDLNIAPPTSGSLTGWAKQGVFLLNTVLTVRQGEANSHRKKGWEKFTDEVIRQLNEHAQGVVFVLWGKPAEKKASLIDASRHAIIAAPHPSPLSAHRGFFGSQPFSKANESLARFGRSGVQWDSI